VTGSDRRSLEPFWVEVIGALRETHPSCHLVAEAYWDRQADLLAQGFDRCYDKDLTDELLAHDVAAIRRRLSTEVAVQHRTLRFVENHDERRAAAAFGPVYARAAAAVAALAPGGLLLFEGQLEGRRTRVPVGIGRRPDEAVDRVLRGWYSRRRSSRCWRSSPASCRPASCSTSPSGTVPLPRVP
jgi:hypothetical protein